MAEEERKNDREVLQGSEDRDNPTNETDSLLPYVPEQEVKIPEVEESKEPWIILSDDDLLKIGYGVLILPISDNYYWGATSLFGPREPMQIDGHVTQTFHPGTDFAAAEGTPVRSILEGEVINVGWCNRNGNFVLIQHNENFLTYSAHLHDVLVKQGDRLAVGQVFATVGNTGALSFGAHLHFEYRDSNNNRLDAPLFVGGRSALYWWLPENLRR
jgi:murein DD-endopeptidase MepM/ murein hydrolase activator NlpD